MEELDKYLFQPKKFEEIITNAKIVIDTNVLLAAYQYRNMTFKELIHTLNSLNGQSRLVIPSHVLKEFFKNRPQRIVEIIQTVQQVRDSLQSVKEISNIENKIPSLDYLSCSDEIKKAEINLKEAYSKYNNNIKSYKVKLSELINELKSFFNYDPILVEYQSIFKKSFFKPETLKDEEQLLKDFNLRVKNQLPPGYKDGNKTENGEGDYIIWEHILQLDSDVIFVSADNKPDWVYKDPNGNVINARRELVEEFYEKTNGKSFCIVHPSVFLKAHNPSVDKEVIEDMNIKLVEVNKFKIPDSVLKSIEYLNEEGNSVLANSKYASLWKALINNPISSIKHQEYVKGTNSFLNQAIYSVLNNRAFHSEVIDRANKIAQKSELTDKEKEERYNDLASWALINQD